MEITDVRVRSISDTADRLKAVCTVTFDGSFVIRDVKIVDGTNGLFVAMPSRKITVSCRACRHKNAVRAKYCNECGTRLPENQMPPGDVDGRGKLHRDVAHPITSEFRAIVQERVIDAYRQAVEEYEGTLEQENRDVEPAHDPEPAESVEQAESVQPAESVEPETEAETESASGGGSDDYMDMIAGLKGGKDAGGRTEPRERGGRPARGRGRRGSGGGSGGGRDREAQPQAARSQPQRDASDEPSAASKPTAPKAATPKPAQKAVPAGFDDDAPFSAGLDIEPVTKEQPKTDRISIEEPAAKPVASEDANEDSLPFGMGLL